MAVFEDEDDVLEPGADTYDLTPQLEVDPVTAAWTRWRDEFAAVVNDGAWSIEELEDRVAAKKAIFFPGAACALVTEVIRYPTGLKTLHVRWAVGDHKELLAMTPGLEAVARMMGCRQIAFDNVGGGRELLEAQGFKVMAIKMAKAL